MKIICECGNQVDLTKLDRYKSTDRALKIYDFQIEKSDTSVKIKCDKCEHVTELIIL